MKATLCSTASKIVAGIILGGTALWLAVAFVSFLTNCLADQSLVMSEGTGMAEGIANDAGEGGARLSELLINQGFGVGAVVVIVWLACMSLKLLLGQPKFRPLDFTIKSLIAMITLSVVVGMLCIGLDTTVNWGGFHGRLINEKVYEFIGWSGAFILSVVLISIFVVICLRDVVKWIMKKKRQYDEKRRIQREAEEAERRKQEEIRAMELRERKDQALSGEGVEETGDAPTAGAPESVLFDPESDTLFDIPDDPEDEPDTAAASTPDDIIDLGEEIDDAEAGRGDMRLEETPAAQAPARTPENSDNGQADTPEIAATANTQRMAEIVAPAADAAAAADPAADPAPADNALPETGAADVMTVNVNQIEKGDAAASESSGAAGLFTHEYKFPPTTYLRPGVDKISVDVDEQMENKERIRKTLNDFGIAITSIEATVGPTVTLYEIRPDAGVKIAKIRNLEDDIALSLSAKGVRIIAPIPGKGTVGIEVANKDPQTVSMRTIIQSKNYQEPPKKLELPIALGSTISNEVYMTDLTKMPHLLVAGATGQGKSVGLNAIITSLLYKKRPEELKFVMVDPKRVEFSLYSKIEKYYLAKIPNSEQPIITNMENVVATLSSLCVEMDERYKLLEKAYVRQVVQYNEKFRAKTLDPATGTASCPI